jgi:hypothetical protein
MTQHGPLRPRPGRAGLAGREPAADACGVDAEACRDAGRRPAFAVEANSFPDLLSVEPTMAVCHTVELGRAAIRAPSSPYTP